MKKLLSLLLFFSPIVTAQETEFSYTYIDITATNAEGVGYLGDVYLGLPASLYIKGSVRDEEVKSDSTIYQRSKKVAALGYHHAPITFPEINSLISFPFD